MTRHVDDDLARAPTRAVSWTQARAFSVEAHLSACADCRAAVPALADRAAPARGWCEIDDAVDAPRAGVVERLLARLGVRAHDGPPARGDAVAARCRGWPRSPRLALAVVLGRARGDRGVMLFLLVAPLLPLAGVAAAFGPRADPTYELGARRPARGSGCCSLRTVAVVAATTLLARVARARAAGARLDGRGLAAAGARAHAREPRRWRRARAAASRSRSSR